VGRGAGGRGKKVREVIRNMMKGRGRKEGWEKEQMGEGIRGR